MWNRRNSSRKLPTKATNSFFVMEWILGRFILLCCEGAQVVIGANDKYIGLCRRHWMRGDLGPDFDIHKV